MNMPLNSMISLRVTALFYHDALIGALILTGTAVLCYGVWWFWGVIGENDSRAIVKIQPLSRRTNGYQALYWGLGVLWILDGLLQLQPAMPNSAFLEMVIAPLLSGQPTWFIHVLGGGIQAWSDAPILANILAVYIQLGIGLILLLGRNRWWGRWGLWTTIGWGFFVWIWGEGLGMVLTPFATMLQGDPGSVFFYMGSAVLLLASERWWLSGHMTRWIRWGLVGLWLWGAAMQALPGSGEWKSIGQIYRQSAQNPQPSFLSTPLYHLAHWATVNPGWANGLVVLGLLALAMLWAGRPFGRVTMALSYGVLAFMWWAGQDFGVLGGVGTDLQTAPILALIVSVGRLSRISDSGQAHGKGASVDAEAVVRSG